MPKLSTEELSKNLKDRGASERTIQNVVALVQKEARKEAEKNRLTHRQFARSDEDFKEACRLADVAPNARQASKWRGKMGAAWKFMQRSNKGA